MLIVWGMATGVVILTFVCVTCCVGYCAMVIPYIGTVVLLPVGVFFECYALYFLQQFGSEYTFFAADPAAPTGFPVVMGPRTTY